MTVSPQSSRAAGWDRAILLLLVAAWVFAMACIAKGSHDFNSDGATAPLQAADILRGNVFLSDWSAPIDTFYTLDIALNAVLTSVMGLTLGSLALQSLLVFLVVALAAYFLARRPGVAGWITGVLLIIFLGWPTPTQTHMMFGVIAHIPTLGCALLGLLALSGLYAPMTGGGRRHGWLIYGLVLFLAAAGDPFIWYIAGLPFLAAGAVVAWRGHDWRPWKQILVVTLAAGLAAKALTLGLQHQGFHILQFRSSFRDYAVSWDKLPFNLWLAGRSWLILFGWPALESRESWLLLFEVGPGHFLFGQILAVARILGAAWSVVMTWKVVRKAGGDSGRHYFDYALLAGVLFNHASFIFSSMPVDDRSSHYLLPSFVFMAILTARRAAPILSGRWVRSPGWLRPLVFALLAALFTSAMPWLWALGHAPANVADRELADWLRRRGLQHGYADYWQANIVTLLAGEKAQVAPTVVSPTGRIAPRHWNSKAGWYREPANFYISLPENDDARAAVATFGPASETDRVGPYRVMIWDHDIQPALHDYGEVIKPADLPLNVASLWQVLAPGVVMNGQGVVVDGEPRPQPAVIVYGPYARLPAGRYVLQFVLRADEAARRDTIICEATIQKGDVALNRKTFTGAEFADAAGRAVTLTITSPGPDEPVEFRVWRQGAGKLTLLSLTLDKD